MASSSGLLALPTSVLEEPLMGLRDEGEVLTLICVALGQLMINWLHPLEGEAVGQIQLVVEDDSES